MCILLTTSFVSANENSTDKFQNEDNILLKDDNDYKNFTDLSKEIDDLNKTELILNNDYSYKKETMMKELSLIEV